MPRLTILMPTYNAAPYVREAVDSVLNQTFSDFELWAIDDGSTDNTVSLLRGYNDPRVQVFVSDKNQGRVAAVNSHVHAVTTPFFTITDADDVSHSTRLERQMHLMEKNASLMMCGSSYWAMDEEGFLVREMKLLTRAEDLRARARMQSPFMGGTTIMRTSLLQYFPDFYRTYFKDNLADADLACRILDRFQATNVPEALYYYRIVPTSLSRKRPTARSLNVHRLVGFLSAQRQLEGVDCLEQGNIAAADAFMRSIEAVYEGNPSLLKRHEAFFHLYWGLTGNAWTAIRTAIVTRPSAKNLLAGAYIIFRIAMFSLTRSLNKKHYSELLN